LLDPLCRPPIIDSSLPVPPGAVPPDTNAGQPPFLAVPAMALDKKQKKQLDLDQKKIAQLRLQLSGAKKQLDDPEEVRRLEAEIATTQARINKLKEQA